MLDRLTVPHLFFRGSDNFRDIRESWHDVEMEWVDSAVSTVREQVGFVSIAVVASNLKFFGLTVGCIP